MAEHVLEPRPDAVVDTFSRERPPVLEVEPGDRLRVVTLDAWGHLEAQRSPGEERPQMFPERRGHCLAGPIAVRGAEPGDLLAVHLVDLWPDWWGWTNAGAHDTALNVRLGVRERPPAWLLWEIDADKRHAHSSLGYGVETAPFLGVLGLPPDEPGEHSTIPPRPCGGNIDCRELVAGSTLYLPVTVPGVLLCVGDGHAAQGDGEVSGTAIECGMTTDLVVELVPSPALPVIHAETPAGRITFGFSSDLNEATATALDAMLDWMARLFDLGRSEALALASVAVDLRVTQVVNRTWGVHALLVEGRLD